MENNNDVKNFFATNLKYLREKNNIEQLELAELLGRKSSSSISEWEKGKYTPKAGILNDIAKIFSIPLSKLMNENLTVQSITTLDRINQVSSGLKEPRQEKVLNFAENQLTEQEESENSKIIQFNDVMEEIEYETLHVHGLESAGDGEWQEDDLDIEVQIPKSEIPDTFDDLAMVVGDSMRPMLHNADILFIRFTKQIEIGEIGVFRTGRGNFVKKLREGYLESLNPDYDDIYFDEDEEVEAIGVVVDYYRK